MYINIYICRVYINIYTHGDDADNREFDSVFFSKFFFKIHTCAFSFTKTLVFLFRIIDTIRIHIINVIIRVRIL